MATWFSSERRVKMDRLPTFPHTQKVMLNGIETEMYFENPVFYVELYWRRGILVEEDYIRLMKEAKQMIWKPTKKGELTMTKDYTRTQAEEYVVMNYDFVNATVVGRDDTSMKMVVIDDNGEEHNAIFYQPGVYNLDLPEFEVETVSDLIYALGGETQSDSNG